MRQRVAMSSANKKLSKDVVVVNALGLHARAAAKISKCAQNSTSGVWIVNNGVRADASSILDILTLGCAKGTRITIEIEDISDLKLLESLVELVEGGFGE